MSEPTSDLCAAYGCPLMGTFGVNSKWYCACHFNANPSLNDAITSELHRQKPLVDQIMHLRRNHEASGKLEGELINLIHEIGHQASIPTAPVTGPTHATTHFTEQSA